MAQKKRRQTFEKLKREQAVRERRVRKQQRKEAARLAKDMDVPQTAAATDDANAEDAVSEARAS